MIKKLTLIIVSLTFSSYAEFTQDNEETLLKSRKCKTFNNVKVCNSMSVGGNNVVDGSLTAGSFFLPSGEIISGIRNYAILVNQLDLISGSNILWTATPVGNVSSGITVNPLTGAITLPTPGLFLVQYSVRIHQSPYNGTSTTTAQLQQTVGGIPTNITESTIINNQALDGINVAYPIANPEITGYALINATSTTNNTLNLVITFDGNDTIPATTGPDANAQLIIMQLN